MLSRRAQEQTYHFPSDKPVWTITTFFMALAALCGSLWFEFSSFTALQQYWLPTYVYSTVLSHLNIKTSRYCLMLVEHTDHKFYLPTADEVETGTTITSDRKRLSFRLTEQAIREGKRLILSPSTEIDNQLLTDRLRAYVYDGYAASDLTFFPLTLAGVVLVLGLIHAVPADKKRALIRKYGRRVKGPEEVTPREFNRRFKSDGIGFWTQDDPTIFGKLLRQEWQKVCVPRSIEDNHFLIMGDSGSGKSSLVRQMLLDISQRGETAIVYDPALEYTGQFYDPKRGDIVLNPLDQRMPYWTPATEILRPAEALTLAAALFPDAPKENPFFVEGPRKIFAHLLSLGLTTDELIWCLSYEEELDRKLKGTELASLVYVNAGQQRGGILASLSMVADSLKLLPKKAHTAATWSALEWSEKRHGWIFITSLPSVRKQLRPLISMWLDVLILRLMNQGQRGPTPVWFVLDELSSLHHLPQLHTAITENRKSGNPMVLSFQGRSQLEASYGDLAEAMFSQPASKIFLKTSEPNSAQWISNLIGNMEVERLHESRTKGQMPNQRESRTEQIQRSIEPLVMKEEISGLDKLEGFLKCGNLVVKIRFRYIWIPKEHEDFLERPEHRKKPEFLSVVKETSIGDRAATQAEIQSATEEHSTEPDPSGPTQYLH